MRKLNPIISWWVTPKLPYEDIVAKHNLISKWITHPIKRRIARVYLNFLKKVGKIKVIAITGSTGKTTTTEILASILKEDGETVYSATGVDPVYNIPNTILRAKLSTKYLILEMSVEYKNEMDYYLWLASPDVGLITNIDATHIKYFENIDGVLEEKGKLLKSLSRKNLALINTDDLKIMSLKKYIKAKIVFFGIKSEIFYSKVTFNSDMSTDFVLNINSITKNIHINAFGLPVVNNALASIAVAHTLGLSLEKIASGLEKFRMPPHRLNIVNSKNSGLVFDDTYNSNPKAASESLDAFCIAAGKRKKIVVIGDMLELGNIEEGAHRNLGKKIGNIGVDYLIAVGSAARFILEEASKKINKSNCYLVQNYLEAFEIVNKLRNSKSAIFVKGSRSIHLDKLVEKLI